jgi:hypothetical protein
MKIYGGMKVQIYIFLNSALVGSEWSASRPCRFIPGESPRYPLDRRLSGPQSRSGRRGEEKILDPTGTRTPTRQNQIQISEDLQKMPSIISSYAS